MSGVLSINNTAPGIPGAYAIDNSFGSFPIFCSLTNTNIFWSSGTDINGFIVLPRYKVIMYNEVGYTGGSTTIDNTSGTVIIFSDTGQNTVRSIELYYESVKITQTGLS